MKAPHLAKLFLLAKHPSISSLVLYIALLSNAQRHLDVEGPRVPLGSDQRLQQSSLVGKSVWAGLACVGKDVWEKEECPCP